VLSTDILREPRGRALARPGLGLQPLARRDRAEREKQLIEAERRKRHRGSRERASLREELLAQQRDPKTLPVSRRLVMDGGLAGAFLGFASLARGPISEERPRLEKKHAAGPTRPMRTTRKDARPRRTEKKRKQPERKIPDRPATTTELDDLAKRFGWGRSKDR